MGLDGSIKLRRNRAIEIDELFDLIDSMPMRKQEIQRQKRAEKLEEKRKEERQENK
ncbi:hypothetical protein GCM10010832_19690 [Psychroflexus planctonicus]|uniref:DUF4174 domain-containing protein n=2 Tax=Psychroflexus planctonicus TaxID=1526575 RepID=A0ABQ1SJ73_9FLAO|nr:hypothetical protein GCM10010832_19690 [Psychroflexus planctonicus]